MSSPQSRIFSVTPKQGIFLVAGLCSALPSCSKTGSTSTPPAPSPPIVEEPLAPAVAPGSKTLFTRLSAKETGIDFVNATVDDHPMRRLFVSAFVCGGVAAGDVDGDGLVDLYFANGPGKNRLFRQTSPFRFEDITTDAGVDGGTAWGAGVSMIDIDGDQDLDIYVCNHDAPNQLYINNGAAVFEEKARASGMDIVDASHTPAFCDYDLDGDLDLFLLTNRYYYPGGKLADSTPVLDVDRVNRKVTVKPEFSRYVRITGEVPGSRPGSRKFEWKESGRDDFLLRNNGNGRFTDVTRETGIESFGFGLSATWWDYNDDGHPDLYVGNDFQDPDYFYHNNGDGTFTNIIRESVPHTSWFSMGADFGDLDEDGLWDFLIADMSGSNHYKQKTAMGAMSDSAHFLATAEPRQYMRNALYLNTGTRHFMEAAYLTGLADTDWTWTVKLCDFDNDSHLDVFFSNGMSRNFNDSDNKIALDIRVGETQWDRHVRAKSPPQKEQNLCYRNQGGLRFADVSKEWGLDHVGMSFASLHVDLDRDGDLDLVNVNLNEPASVYRNESASNRVVVRLQGKTSNHHGIGARITLRAGNREQRRMVTAMRGYQAAPESAAYFGLGEDDAIDALVVDWPSGQRQEFRDLKANRCFVISEPPGKNSSPPATEKARPLYELVDAGAQPLRHRENPYDDFKDQPLLPNKLSQFGPGMAVGDVDGDGRDDLVLSGSRGYATQLCLNQGNGQFAVKPLGKDILQEDLGLILFEADGDGDLDLYVVSGGSEYRRGHAALRDRLYLNDGTGQFTRAPAGSVPDLRESGSVVIAADYDRDGDVDLFVGARIVPGAYPETPRSYLLQNDGKGVFADVTAAASPQLQLTGLVTGALFTDVDGDGWVDLLVTHEWGPVKYYHNNQQGAFSDRTAEAGLADRLGWWNGIAAADLDGDSDTDYVVTNFGHNTKYHASPENPSLLYYGDFEGDGKRHLVEAEFENNTLYPVRGRSCSSTAMPHLANAFPTYDGFALASVEQIYTQQLLARSLRMECNTLDSGVLLNDGEGGFLFQALPVLAQIAPGFGVVATEIDGDGRPDIYVAQNFFGAQVETGHMDGGVSLLMTGNGDGSFSVVRARESGLVVPGNASAMAVLDFNGDARPDFVVARNNDTALALASSSTTSTPRGKMVTVELHGAASNPQAFGARVTLTTTGQKEQSAEVYGGSGYLSQTGKELFFGLGHDDNNKVISVKVRWPDGKETMRHESLDTQRIQLAHPAAGS